MSATCSPSVDFLFMRGLSLLELLIVIFLISLIFSFAMPLSTQWYQEQAVWLIEKEIEQAIAEGMQDSMILGEPLRLMPLHSANWATGLMLVQEHHLKQEKLQPIHVWQWAHTSYQINWHGFLGHSYVRFTPDLNQAAMNGYFLIENQAHRGVKMIINRTGRVRSHPV